MLRLFFLVILFYGLGTGLRDGWIVVKWRQLLNESGFTSIDAERQLNWKDFIIRLPQAEKSKDDFYD